MSNITKSSNIRHSYVRYMNINKMIMMATSMVILIYYTFVAFDKQEKSDLIQECGGVVLLPAGLLLPQQRQLVPVQDEHNDKQKDADTHHYYFPT